MEVVKREELMDVDSYKEIFDIEFHHNHEIIRDENGTIRWKGDPKLNEMITKTVNLNDLWYIMFFSMGLTKNSEEVRKLYRDMGYSLSGYWEIFFWEMNNFDAEAYSKSQLRKKAAQRRKATSGSAV
jgi:hypothetical protein